MSEMQQNIVSDAMRPLESIEIPDRLKVLVDRHYQTVLTLASTLLMSGKTDQEVRAAIQLICNSFEAELFNAIRSLTKNGVK